MTTTNPGQVMLTAADRCDGCSARAYVRFFTSSGVLELCAHHFNKHGQTITEAGYVIHDQRHQLHDGAVPEAVVSGAN